MEGWVKIHRAVLDWQWSDNPEMFALWMRLILEANHEDRMWHGIMVPRGAMVSGREELSKITGLSVSQVRTGLKRLQDGGEIELKSTNKYTIITICKYADYQDVEEVESPTNRQQIANKSPQTRIKEDYKKESISNDIDEKERELKAAAEKIACPKKTEYSPGVRLTAEQYERLVNDFGKDDTDGCINFLSDYKKEKAYKTKDDNLTIRRWVMSAFRERQQRENRNFSQTTRKEITDVNDLWQDR